MLTSVARCHLRTVKRVAERRERRSLHSSRKVRLFRPSMLTNAIPLVASKMPHIAIYARCRSDATNAKEELRNDQN